MAQVCPDRQLLSVYFDGELPSPWKEKMEAHIDGCPVCARQLEKYRCISLSHADTGEGEAGLESARERVWQKLEPVENRSVENRSVENRSVENRYTYSDAYPVTARPAALPGAVRWGRAVWRRSISIPLPAAVATAAAAILLLIALAFLMVLRVTETEGMSGMTFASEAEIDTPGVIPVSNMEDVLQYLDSRDNGEIIILRLPESRSFVNYGEPAIVKAANYPRSGSGRRRP